MLHPDPILVYDLARMRQRDLALDAEWERLARMARTASARKERMPARPRLAAMSSRLSRSLVRASATPRAGYLAGSTSQTKPGVARG